MLEEENPEVKDEEVDQISAAVQELMQTNNCHRVLETRVQIWANLRGHGAVRLNMAVSIYNVSVAHFTCLNLQVKTKSNFKVNAIYTSCSAA